MGAFKTIFSDLEELRLNGANIFSLNQLLALTDGPTKRYLERLTQEQWESELESIFDDCYLIDCGE